MENKRNGCFQKYGKMVPPNHPILFWGVFHEIFTIHFGGFNSPYFWFNIQIKTHHGWSLPPPTCGDWVSAFRLIRTITAPPAATIQRRWTERMPTIGTHMGYEQSNQHVTHVYVCVYYCVLLYFSIYINIYISHECLFLFLFALSEELFFCWVCTVRGASSSDPQCAPWLWESLV